MIHRFKIIWDCPSHPKTSEVEPYSQTKYKEMLFKANLPETVELEIEGDQTHDAGQIIETIEDAFNWRIIGIRFLKVLD